MAPLNAGQPIKPFLEQSSLLVDIKWSIPNKELEKEFSNSEDPALVCVSAIDKKSVYWFPSWIRILNIQEKFKERTKKTSSNISSRVFLPPQSPVLANIYSILGYDVPGTEDVGLSTKFRFNVGPALQPIAGPMPVNRLRHWPNTKLSPGLLYRPTLRKHLAFNQRCFNVDLQSSTLARFWNNIG